MPPADLQKLQATAQQAKQQLSTLDPNMKINASVGELPATSVVSYKDSPDGTTTNTLANGAQDTGRYTKNANGTLTFTPVTPEITGKDFITPQSRIQLPTPTQPTTSSQFVQNLQPAIQAGSDGIIRAQTKEADTRNDLLNRLMANEVTPTGDVYQESLNKQISQLTGKRPEEFMQSLADANTRLATLQGKFRTGAQAISGAKGQSQAFEGVQLNELDRQQAVEVGNQALLVQALQGNFDTARQIALDTANFATEDRKAELNNLLAQYDAISGVVEGQEAQLIQKERDKVEAEKAELERTQTAIDTAIMSGGATVADMQQLTNPNLSNQEKLSIAQGVVAKTAKADRAIANYGTTLSNQIKEKQLDALKNPSTITGLSAETLDRMSKLTEKQKEAIPQLNDTVQSLTRMKELVNSVGSIDRLNQFTEEGREFNRLAKDVADKMARERTGAVVGEDEQKAFNQILGLTLFSQLTSSPEELNGVLDKQLTKHNQQLYLYDPTNEIRTALNQNVSANVAEAEDSYLDQALDSFGFGQSTSYGIYGL